jgi:hypothetical protein
MGRDVVSRVRAQGPTLSASRGRGACDEPAAGIRESCRAIGRPLWRAVAAATAVYLRTHLDPNNLGHLLVLRANRGALSFEVPEGRATTPAHR